LRIFAIGDLHLSLEDGRLRKPMDVFGEHWRDHHERIAADWRSRVGAEDLVLMPGDLSWARDLEEAEEDLRWLGALPGTKVLIRGNHDWWISGSRKRVRDALPKSVRLILGDCLTLGDVLLFGTRYWQDPDLEFQGLEGIEIAPPLENARILEREVTRLRASVAAAGKTAAARTFPFRLKIALLHFPPTDFRGVRTAATEILAGFGVDACVFGHIHNLRDAPEHVHVDGVSYWPVSCDLIDFRLREIKI
jgi:predicted phosphohydrolase